MVVDASVLVAIIMAEPERLLFERALFRANPRRISPVNWFEAATVAASRSAQGRAEMDLLMAAAGVVITPIDEAQMHLADHARQAYGKGRHPAKLNLGDCFAYALAKAMREPLLFKGGDFAHTDIVPAL
jgi:ribonuclease VapC